MKKLAIVSVLSALVMSTSVSAQDSPISGEWFTFTSDTTGEVISEEEKLKLRIDRTRKLLVGINELYWNDFANLSAMLELCIEILDGKRDEGEDDATDNN